MTTPTNDSQENRGDKKEKGGVVPTDAKRFNHDDTFETDPKPVEERTTDSKSD